MKICVFTDIHGNLKPFEALTRSDDFISADKRICLGDVIGCGPYQTECLELLLKHDVVFLLGNHENLVIKMIKEKRKNPNSQKYSHLIDFFPNLEKYFSLFISLPKNYFYKIGGKQFLFTHYGWYKNKMTNRIPKLRSKTLTKQFGVKKGTDYVIYGHMHAPKSQNENGVTFIDVGSLGLKSPGNYLMIDDENGDVEIKRKHIPMDKDEFLAECKKLAFPKWETLKDYCYDGRIEKGVNMVLITGAGGYIGTNLALKLIQNDYYVLAIDNFSNSKKEYLYSIKEKYPDKITIIESDLCDKKYLQKLFDFNNIISVVHLAGKKYVGESFDKEEDYYKNNVLLTRWILKYMKKSYIKNFVFSSSITVFGNCKHIPADENEKYNPLSPYAKQKMLCEKMVERWTKKKGYGATILRLSNPIGADSDNMLGDDPLAEKYKGLVPYIIDCVNNNIPLKFNGNNHPTKDGTTIRDYIHVQDVANAFFKAVENRDEKFHVYNIGYGREGNSVLDILKEVEKSYNKKINYSFGQKREGDAPIFISNTQKAKEELDFTAQKDLHEMIESQIKFQNRKK